MALSEITFLGNSIPFPLQFRAKLPFSADDKAEYPWLDQPTRYYGALSELGKGGTAIAYRGYVSDARGERIAGTRDVVLKFPNIDTRLFTLPQIRDYLRRLHDAGGREWELARRRLRGCEFANPLIDYSAVEQVPYLGDLLPLPVTAQLFLDEAISLDDYLISIRARAQKYEGTKGSPVDNWSGIVDPQTWVRLARGIAVALADIHLRRIVHGDIWPPNIFIRKPYDDAADPHVIVIDFGEAFTIEPTDDDRQTKDHAYRAPERRNSQSTIAEQADVYSFGKLLLYLGTGHEPILPNNLGGHERRAYVRNKFFLPRNPTLLSQNPYVIDLISKCISLDPIDRPRMIDIVTALNSYIDRGSITPRISRSGTTHRAVPLALKRLETAWQDVENAMGIKGARVSQYLEDVVVQKTNELLWMIGGLSKDVVDLSDTRENLILALINLFENLKKGDRFLSITSPHLWQGGALGLDGRYLTATALATKLGASIQRSIVFSVQEVGHVWADELVRNLEKLSEDRELEKDHARSARHLAKRLQLENRRFQADLLAGIVREFPDSIRTPARQRLSLVVRSYLDARRSAGNPEDWFHQGRYVNSDDCHRMYLGLKPVSTVNAMRSIKAAHPMSVFCFNSAADVADRYLLMMTDCANRNSLSGYANGVDPDMDSTIQPSRPELRGVRMFRSALGIPEDRIKRLEEELRESSNIGPWIGQLTLKGHSPRA